MLLSTDGLDSTAQSSRRSIPSGDTPIPATLRDLLTSRLDALGGAKRTAQLASAMGTDFTYELLEAASPLSDSQLREDLQALVDADLVRLQRRRTQTSYCFKHVLVRDAAYDSMLNETRRQAHATIARAIEQDLPGLARERTDLLALHHAAADNVERALDCAMNASMAALQRSANAEALQMGTLALDWLKAVPNTKRRQEAELGLGAIVTPALMALRGFGDPTVKARAERTLKLAGQVGSSPATAPALGALGTYYMVLADRARCREVSERLLTLAEETKDDGLKVAALPSLGASMLDEGKFAEARQLLERAITLHDVEAHAHHAFQFGLDSLAYARMLRGLTMCHLGFPDQGLRDANAALERAESVNHVSSTVLAVLYHALIGALLDEPALTAKFAQRTISVAAENALKFHLGYGSILHAWATGDLPALAQGVGMLEVLGAGLALPFYRSLLAQAEAKSLNLQGALEIAQRSLAWIRETGNLSYLAGTLAAKGSYLWQLNARNPEPAEEALREAISVAQAQGTKFQELRAALELGRVLGGTKRSVEARALLEPLVAWFAEGFDLPDLRRARALLKELGSSEPRVRSSRTRKRRTAPQKGEKS